MPFTEVTNNNTANDLKNFSLIWLISLLDDKKVIKNQVKECITKPPFIFKLMKIPMSPDSFIEILPGMLAFFTLLIIWMNFQMACSLALKTNKSIRKPTIKQNIYLPPVWDIALVTSLWLIIANHLFIDSPLLGIFSHAAACISAFPLFIDGLEIAQLMTRFHRLPRYATVIFIVLTFLLVWPMIFVVVLGLVEPLYGLKKKYYSKFN